MMRRFAIALIVGVFGASVLFAAGCTQAGSNLPEPENLARETTETGVFYATGRSLFEERKIVDAENVYLSTLDEWLLATPSENPDIAIVQPQAEALSAELEDGVLTIDWSSDVLLFEATDSEKVIALAGILRMFGQFPDVEQVRFTVEGQTDGELLGNDVEVFWGAVTLRDQPWDVIRPQPPSEEDTTTAS